MRKLKKPASIYEALRKKWKIRIMLEKAYTEDAALWMTDRIESLISHMQYGYALVAYYKQDDIHHIEGHIIYWDVELQAWRSFQLENFLEWRPIN